MKLSDAFSGFALFCSSDGFSASTVEIYRWAIDLIIRRLGDVEVSQVSEADIQDFWVWLRNDYVPCRSNGDASPLAGGSLLNVWTGMRSFFGWLHENKFITRRPDLQVARPEFTYRVIEPFSENDIRNLLAACDRTKPAVTERRASFTSPRPTAVRDRALVMLLLDTGLRVSEMCRLRVRDVNLENGEICVLPFGSGRKTKGRTVFLGRSSKKALWHYLASRGEDVHFDDPLFLSSDGSSMDRGSVLHLLVDLGKKAGVSGSCHPHRFRHTFCYLFIKNGGDPFALQRLAGWSDIKMAMTYVLLVGADVKEVHARSSPVDRFRLWR